MVPSSTSLPIEAALAHLAGEAAQTSTQLVYKTVVL